MHSRIYVGQVSHKRYLPHEHVFKYRLFMMYLDLDELTSVFDRFLFWSSKRFNLAHFNRKHHLGDHSVTLKQSVIELVYKQKGIKLDGPVRLLTNLSYFGFSFNPVSFYYCYDKEGQDVEVIVAEVNNTPWGEQHCYVLPASEVKDKKHIHGLNKEFHVSPFNPMNQQYEWQLSEPQDRLSVYMQNFTDQSKVFDAALSLSQQKISHKSLAKILISFPFMTLKVVAAIYYEAFKLWLKRTPIYDHPVIEPAKDPAKNHVVLSKNK